jgi:hypothetical protein
MYRKGLSSRANKVSSLVASSDNAGTGTIEQASVPNAGVFGIRKNVFRNLPRIPPKKSVTPFSSMKSKPKSSEAESGTSQPAPEPAPASFPLTLKFNSDEGEPLRPTSDTHVEFNSDYTYDIIEQNGAASPKITETEEIGIPIPLPDTLIYDNVSVEVSWDEVKVLSTYTPDSGSKRINFYLVINNNTSMGGDQGKRIFSNGNNLNSPATINVTDKTFNKLSLIFWDESYRSLDVQDNWGGQPLKISIKNLVVTISEPASN